MDLEEISLNKITRWKKTNNKMPDGFTYMWNIMKQTKNSGNTKPEANPRNLTKLRLPEEEERVEKQYRGGTMDYDRGLWMPWWWVGVGSIHLKIWNAVFLNDRQLCKPMLP